MKTSVDIYSKREPNAICRFLLIAFCLAALFGTASCVTIRPPVAPVAPAPAPAHVGPFCYQEIRRDIQYVVASWYGPKFHGRPTTSGEIFNMYALTCAHRELPFGTKLKVTNIQNNKKVICVVNDRGPFIPGRCLDLSYASARKIGLIGPGIGTVRMEIIGRDLSYVRMLTVQAGSFRDRTDAKRLKRGLTRHFRDVYIAKADARGIRGYRVRIGMFNTQREAHKVKRSLIRKGHEALIVSFGLGRVPD
ncbi:septal ring lytic transglycosylase RlpA family protein [Thermodesulfovibrionales bacterium]|nr:septal ring lytic transglycosylase RlpA family protein [Thermodesulfovibrionales bacterium]